MIISVNMAHQSYDIVLERGALSRVGEYIGLDRKVLVVTDDGVPSEYAECVANACRTAVIVTLPQGEKSKNFDNYKFLLGKMLENGFSRVDCVVAVGGGVIGDMSGFAAATYMRGIDFYNIPTTLLSQVDSSIGGKVAIDMDGVKNIVGAFYQPKKVIIDPDVLDTLDIRQFRAGLVEAIKMACTCDLELFEFIENSDDIKRDIDKIIEGALKIKKYVVEKDPTEKNLRRVLNFGHTIGHAIESSYLGEYLHGECVAFGMLAVCSHTVGERLKNILKKNGLETEVKFDEKEIIGFMMHDKKMTSDGIAVVFVNEIGSFEFRKADKNQLEKYLEKLK